MPSDYDCWFQCPPEPRTWGVVGSWEAVRRGQAGLNGWPGLGAPSQVGDLMQEKKFWTLVALAGLTAVTLVRPERDLDCRPASRPFRTPLTKDGIVSGSLSVAGSSSPGASPHPDSSPWLLFRADWSAVLWRVYKKMNDNRLLAGAGG